MRIWESDDYPCEGECFASDDASGLAAVDRAEVREATGTHGAEHDDEGYTCPWGSPATEERPGVRDNLG